METETGFSFKTRSLSTSPKSHPREKWKRKLVSVSLVPGESIIESLSVVNVVNSENSDPAKTMRANLPAAGKFARGQKKKIPGLRSLCNP